MTKNLWLTAVIQIDFFLRLNQHLFVFLNAILATKISSVFFYLRAFRRLHIADNAFLLKKYHKKYYSTINFPRYIHMEQENEISPTSVGVKVIIFSPD